MKVENTEISIDLAHKLELEFLSHFEGLFWDLNEIYNPVKKKSTSIKKNKNAELNASTEREKVRQLLIKLNKTDIKLENCPYNRTMAYTISEKRILGAKKPGLKVIASVKMDLDAIIKNNKISKPLDRFVVEQTIAELTENPDIYHYIGIFSPTGWSKSARIMSQDGANYKFLLIETPGSGFNIVNPVNDASLNRLFDPEDDKLKQQRAFVFIKELKELQAENRVVLLTDIAETCKIPEKIVVQAAQDFAKQTKSFKVEFISKSWVIYRDK